MKIFCRNGGRQIQDQLAPTLDDATTPSMATHVKSRWADDDNDVALEAQHKKEKESKKKAKADKQRRVQEGEIQREQDLVAVSSANEGGANGHGEVNGESERPLKRRRLSAEQHQSTVEPSSAQLLRFPAPEWGPCRHVDNFEKLNHIEEGSYGWVSRAKEIATGEIVALKKLKIDITIDGFPVTGLREIQTLKASKHENIVALREVVVGDKFDE